MVSVTLHTMFPQRNIKRSLNPTHEALKKHMAICTSCQMMADKRMGHHGQSKKTPVFFNPVKMFERTHSQDWQKAGHAELHFNRQNSEVEHISKFPYKGSNEISSVQCPRMIRTLFNLVKKTTNQNLIKRLTGHQRWNGKTGSTYREQWDIRSSDTDVLPSTGCQMIIKGVNTRLKGKDEKPEISFTQKEQHDIKSSETHLPPSTETPPELSKYSTKGLKSVEIITKVKTGLLRRNKKRDLAWCTFKEQQEIRSSDASLQSFIVTPGNSFHKKEMPVRRINEIRDTGDSQKTENPQVSSASLKE